MHLHDAEYYKKIGFKCGLEIHQRLSTREKLFCSCSTESSSDNTIAEITRRQRAVAGELGAIDRSTSFESSRGRNFVYNIFKNSSCLVDIDEEPPHHVNPEAVETALRLASAFNARIPQEIEPMRKEVVDGSDPSAFQRSMMIAYDGKLAINNREIRITSIFLEEESSGIVSTTNESVVYNVDRIGIPLIEIDTDPSISTPEEARAVALKIGQIIRLTGKREGGSVVSQVQRGIGTIRQDVNVSIAGGTRVEIKGLQEIDTVDTAIENEVNRQTKLIDIKRELIAKGAKVGEAKDLTKALHNSGAKIIRDAISNGGAVFGAGLSKFAGFLGMEINPDRRLGSEISDYAKMSGVKGMIHSDEDMQRYGLTKDEVERIRKDLNLGNEDAFILIAADKSTCERAMGFAIDRAKMALSEVPPETRAVADSKKGTTRFMRPLPGGSRMYPETDAEPVTVTSHMLDKIKQSTVYTEERTNGIMKEVGNRQLAEQLIGSTRLQMYEYITSKVKGVNLVVATTLLEKMKELERSGIRIATDQDAMVEIFKSYAAGKITKAAIGEILKDSPRSRQDVDSLIKAKSLGRISGSELSNIVKGYEKADKGTIIREVMSKYRLNVDGEELNGII